ncbi:SDR family NAD(P)-dependent oxidoreductase [Rhodococcus maanshanensis]|uniref:Short-chain dehydrogenase n=1 Tax=Rhodococcus maanshanensis TaxID=183556 RepID=A0A1H7FSY3_9NOCA|nr:SDR family NAD(P)-dependent oxidoreductase [Rhodococcus maanshanensis]SEK26465.1 Short-chain dehydrogenase [Rhodococcus maanshanensis]
MSEFAGRVAVVTGAGSGMGRTLALGLARRGARLAVSDVDTDGLAATVALLEELGADVRSDRLDVSERESVLRYADAVVEHFGVVNQVYNNAGIAFSGTILESEFKDIERVVDVDYWGVVNGTKAFLPHLIESGDGHVINTSSLYGILALPRQSAYNSAKFAVRGFTESLRLEMLAGGHPVRVTCVHPGGVKTNVANNAGHAGPTKDEAETALYNEKLLRMSPEKAAEIILDGVAKNRARVLVGGDARGLDLMVRVLGSWYQRPMLEVLKRVMPSAKRD